MDDAIRAMILQFARRLHEETGLPVTVEVGSRETPYQHCTIRLNNVGGEQFTIEFD